jgi:hypothetical protein
MVRNVKKGKKGKGKKKGKGSNFNKRKRRDSAKNRKRRRKSTHIPFGIKYNYRNDEYESNLCLYRALYENCEYNDIPVGNSSNIDPVKWIKHQISRDSRRNDGEMGDTLDLINFINKWGAKGHDIAVIVIDEDGNYMEGFAPELYKLEPDDFKLFVIEWQSSCILHFEAVLDEDIINDLKSHYLCENNDFFTWLD